MTHNTEVEEIVKEVNLNIRKNCNATICSVCSGGGYNHDKQRDCTECMASGITNWDFDFLNRKLSELLHQELQKAREEAREIIKLRIDYDRRKGTPAEETVNDIYDSIELKDHSELDQPNQ